MASLNDPRIKEDSLKVFLRKGIGFDYDIVVLHQRVF